ENDPERLFRPLEPHLHPLLLGRLGDHRADHPAARKRTCREENRNPGPITTEEHAVETGDSAAGLCPPWLIGPERTGIRWRNLAGRVPEHQGALPVHLLNPSVVRRKEKDTCPGSLEYAPVPALAGLQKTCQVRYNSSDNKEDASLKQDVYD